MSDKPPANADECDDLSIELRIDGVVHHLALDRDWLSALLSLIPESYQPNMRLPLDNVAVRAMVGHMLWQGSSVLTQFNETQIQRIHAFWLPYWANRSTWIKAGGAVASLAANSKDAHRAGPPCLWMVSLPRAGSNHLMGILANIANGCYRSLYDLGIPGGQATATVVRSHALAPSQFDEELIRLAGRPWDHTTPIIVLLRDLRDVAISLYEYAQHILDIAIDQKDFMERTDYYLVSGIDVGGLRRSTIAPTGIADAMRLFVENWWETSQQDPNMISLKFEDLLVEGAPAYTRAAEAAGISGDRPNDEILQKLVAQFDTDNRPRGKSGAWRELSGKYGTIIDDVERLLADELSLLGYT